MAKKKAPQKPSEILSAVLDHPSPSETTGNFVNPNISWTTSANTANYYNAADVRLSNDVSE